MLCEGGPTLLTRVTEAGELDELCLSLPPMLVGPGAGRAVGGRPWTGGLRDLASLTEGDFRTGMPRFQGEAFEANLRLLDRFEALAHEADCTPAQLCLAWLLHRDGIIIPIPGTTNPQHVTENAAAASVRLGPDMMARIEATVNAQTVSGHRYGPALQASIDTEG